ncbi:MAG: helix-turn-helix domain-containing protein [Candidatus Magnetobacterium sp. LHC-1]
MKNQELQKDVAKEVLSLKDASAFLGVGYDTLREQINTDREFQHCGRKIGREWRFTRRALLHYIDGNGVNT